MNSRMIWLYCILAATLGVVGCNDDDDVVINVATNNIIINFPNSSTTDDGDSGSETSSDENNNSETNSSENDGQQQPSPPRPHYSLTVHNTSQYAVNVTVNGSGSFITQGGSRAWGTTGRVVMSISGHPDFPGWSHTWTINCDETVTISDDEISN